MIRYVFNFCIGVGRLRIFLEVNCVVGIGHWSLVIGHWEKVECVKMFIGSAN